MQNSPTYKRLFSKNSYLLILAALLVTFSFILDNYWSGNGSLGSVQINIENDIQKHEKDFAKWLKDTAITRRMDDWTFNELEVLQLSKKPYFIFRYFVNDIKLHRIIFWNTQTVLPTDEVITAKDSTGFIKLDNGYYAWNKKTTASSVTLALIPVKWNYFVVNTYLENTFAAGKGIERDYDISGKNAGAAVKSIAGNTLFFLAEKTGQVVTKNNLAAVWLRIFAAILVLIFIHVLAIRIAAIKGLSIALLFLLTVVPALRIVSYYFPIPLNFRQFEMFDPSIYGSNIILRSLGDLLINSVLFTWIVLFIHNQVYKKPISLACAGKWVKWLLLAAVCIVLLITTFTAGLIISSIKQ